VDPTTNETYINNLSTGSPIQYMWDFGDGNNGMGFTPTHTYGGPGWYEICLTIGTPNTPACYDTYCDSVFVPSASLRVGGPAAITTWDETSDWSIYPNPVNNELFLNYTGTMTSDLTVEVISVTGQVLTSTIEKNVEPGQIIPVSFEEYAEGIYFITITSHHSQQMVTKKIMK
jgi:PKD repeat protein